MDIRIIYLIVLLILSGFFSGSETALLAVNNIRVRSLVSQKKKGSKKLQQLKKDPQRLIITILIGNNLVNIGASVMATVLATDFFGSSGVGIATGVMTFLVLMFGEIIPKNFAIAHAEKISLKVAGIIRFVSLLLYPFVLFFDGISHAFMKLPGIKRKYKPEFSEHDLRTMVKVGVEEDMLGKRERDFIEGVLEFNDIVVRDVMTPRTKMFALSSETSITSAIRKVIKNKFSRIPVFDDDKDKIIGILYLKDLLSASNRRKKGKIRGIAKKALFVNQETVISEVFKLFQRKRIHIAIVLDEFGGTQGLVTIEDLLEEIVGEILDEKDLSPELIKRISKKQIMVHGNTEIEEINDFFNTNIPKPRHIVTITGFLQYKIKTNIHKNTTLELDNVIITVKEMENNHPVKILIEKK